MTGGSIYIDPDSVSNVSSQIGITAEQLDSLRQSIVPQVNEVISMSYPSIQEIPSVAHPLDATQGNIEAFNYRAQLLAEDLRTTSLKLTQIAEAGRTMNEILLRQTTTFSSTIQGTLSGGTNNYSGIPDWISQAPAEYDKVLEISKTLIEFLSKEFKDNPILSQFADAFKDPKVEGGLFILGYLADVASSGNIDKKTLISDFIGALIGQAVGLIPYASPVIAGFDAIQLGTGVLGYGQGLIANQYSSDPALQHALETTAQGLTTTSKNADVGKVFDDIGSIAYDMVFAGGADVGKDTSTMVNDASNTLNSINQAKVNITAMGVEDTTLALNQGIQNSPLPSSWKHASQSITTTGIEGVSNIANYLTNHPEIANLIPLGF